MRAIHLAREAGPLLVHLDDASVALVDARGELHARRSLPGLVAAATADDGSARLAVDAKGRVHWLAPDLSPERETPTGTAAIALAVDAFGDHVIVADKAGGIVWLDRDGRERGRFASPRATPFLAFVPGTPLLLAAATVGWAGCLNLPTGEWDWSDRPVSTVGSVAAAEGGAPVALACFSDGLKCYGPGGAVRSTLPMPGRCGLAALAFDGVRGLAAGPAERLFLFSTSGGPVEFEDLDAAPTALALSARGDTAFLGHADGRLRAATLA